jgi:hypothetical protein
LSLEGDMLVVRLGSGRDQHTVYRGLFVYTFY